METILYLQTAIFRLENLTVHQIIRNTGRMVPCHVRNSGISTSSSDQVLVENHGAEPYAYGEPSNVRYQSVDTLACVSDLGIFHNDELDMVFTSALSGSFLTNHCCYLCVIYIVLWYDSIHIFQLEWDDLISSTTLSSE